MSFSNRTVIVLISNQVHIGILPLSHKQEASSQSWACAERQSRKLVFALRATVRSGPSQVS